MKPFLFFIPLENFRDEELFEPKKVLEGKGTETKTASTLKKTASGKLGGAATVDFSLNEIKTQDFSGIAFVGGPGVIQFKLYENKELLSLATSFYAENKVVAAICVAPRILAAAGLLKGRKATAFPDDETISILKECGAVFTDKAVEVDGRIITANGPGAAKKFGEAILSTL
ncbi:DJ-1/PfpI family protein [Candidatus Micrarchaeota archaeon]|nr:DJ-1/PfpI family protein [Candidatus Micrarchaeota archaeon]